jgi:hypothetical protein
MHSTIGRALFVVEGEGLPLLRSLQRRIVGSSRGGYGMSLDEARVLLLRACDNAVNGTIKAAIGELLATLEAKPEAWTIAEAVEGIFPAGKLTVGRTVYWNHLPRWLGHRAVVHGTMAKHGFVAPIAVTDVVSRGATTALALARERFAESAAVLDLAAPPTNLGSETSWLRGPSTAGFWFRRTGWVLNAQLIERGQLVPPLRQLARAAKREEDGRSDWERRLLAATRWFSRAYRSEWPADRLASLMFSLECVFIPDGQRSQQGPTLATKLTERFVLNEFNARQQRRWLQGLYDGRSDAVHAGRDYLHDLDVDRFLELTRHVLVTFAGHLVPAHRADGRSCRTFEQAMKCTHPHAVAVPGPTRRRRHSPKTESPR